MYQYDNPTAVSTWTPAAAGTPGYRTNGSPLGGPNASDLDADMDNTINMELCNLVTGVGIALAKGNTTADLTMVLKAIRRIAGGNVTYVATPTATLTADNAGLVLVSAASNNVTITQPLAAAAGGQSLEFTYARVDTSGNTVTIDLAGGDASLPGGLAPFTIPGPGILELRGDGVSQWADISALLNLIGGFTRGGSTSLAFPAAGAAAGTVAASGWTKDPTGLIKNWACIQLIDSTNTTWTFPTAFATGVLKFRSQNTCYASSQSAPANAGIADLVSTNGTTSAVFVCHNTGTTGTLVSFILESEGY